MSPRSARLHDDHCEAEVDHDHDCVAATELARLRAFAEAVRDEFGCSEPALASQEWLPGDHVDDCWHHAALRALGMEDE